MPSFPLAPGAQPSRAPTPVEVFDCLVQLLPPVASPPPLDLLPLVMPLLAVLRLWNIHLRSEARRALEVVPETDTKLRKRLKVLSKDKTQDALEQKLKGFGIMVGLWRVQSAILAGTTAKADLQPVIDEYYPPAPLPPYFLASDTSSLPPERCREIESTIMRTRKTCQTLRKKAALVAGAYIGPPEGLRDALIAAEVSDGPIGLSPASLEGDDGTARAILAQARNIKTLWEELSNLFPLPSHAPVSASLVANASPVIPVKAPDVAGSSQGSIVEDSQKSIPQRSPAHSTVVPKAKAPATLLPLVPLDQSISGPSKLADTPPRLADPAPAISSKGRPPTERRDGAPPVRDAPGRAPSASHGRPVDALTQPLLANGHVENGSRPVATLAPVAASSLGSFDLPPRRPSSTVAPPRLAVNPLKRAFHRFSGRRAFDSDSSSDSEEGDDQASRRAAPPSPAKRARHDAPPKISKAGTLQATVANRLSATNSWESLEPSRVGSKNGSQATTDSSLGYVELPAGTTPRPRQSSPRPSSSGASRE